MDQHASGRATAPNTVRIISCKAWKSPVDYPSWEYKSDIKESGVLIITMHAIVYW